MKLLRYVPEITCLILVLLVLLWGDPSFLSAITKHIAECR